ncbi:MAG: hypothetical protein M3Y49_09740 [Actinomycetota bacterium]|nr:hypothetical protein [Actinomycetota bacterium]
MSVHKSLLHPIYAFTHPARDLSPGRAENRMSAYIYGDVLVLAATAGVSAPEIRTGQALLILLGTVISTYLAHVLADIVGAVFAGHTSVALLRAELRDAIPVASASLPPFALLTAAAITWLPALWAQTAACCVLLARLAGDVPSSGVVPGLS